MVLDTDVNLGSIILSHTLIGKLSKKFCISGNSADICAHLQKAGSILKIIKVMARVCDLTGKKTVSGNKVYAADPFPVLKESSGLIDPLWANVRFAKGISFTTVVIGALAEGQTVESALPEFQKQLTSLAEAAGYKVVNQ